MNDDTILVINCGSSSLKFALFNATTLACIASGLAEKLSTPGATLSIKNGDTKSSANLNNADHSAAIAHVIESLKSISLLTKDPLGIGHRVVHGGEAFSDSVPIDNRVIAEIQKCAALAPLHNPANLLGIELMAELYPSVPQVAVFDTAFHQSLPETSYLYPIPYQLYTEHGIRRYGFHGTSHKYVAEIAANKLNKPLNQCNLITAHLGNGCSVTAIKQGVSVDTSMGLTPLEGLMMGTRSGDIDPGLFEFLCKTGMSSDSISQMLNKESGLKGLSGETNDMRTLFELADNGHERASLAIDVFCFKLVKYIAAMAASLPSIDALVFTGGIGENADRIRAAALEKLSIFGFKLSQELNNTNGESSGGRITEEGSTLAYVIPTNEELVIAKDTLKYAKK
ncbi:acetate/propionate family kinase [Alkalimarinus sediminis]|uniref:Acetate kinase n=1 Tax=Alkalimarinus sediminis TaxID=1632866 RepID=A0A9E8HKN5_9ALTE|nr:acetate kinase [Alkalimarinus sediminis]UZW75902.1 acetate kinase [Alkalimarinus sediminis]